MIVHRHEQHFPTCTFNCVTSVVGDAMTRPRDAPELLRVDVQQFTGPLVFVAPHGSTGSRSQSFDNPARASTRLTVLSEMPTLRPMRD